ncbi:BON domain-containing protein [Pseudomonas sp. F1_0610]|uniref:BON domain-containing protein n=1 Tax=Pseudomonas sp. F1_0610 TaxID=3114284 RepID=UPI0039C23DF5
MIRQLIAITLSALVLTACGSRSIGNNIDDKFIAPEVRSAIYKASPELSTTNSHVVATVYNGVTLLAGQTPRADLKALAERAAASVNGVKRVQNEIQVAAPSSASARASDIALTTAVKARLVATSDVPSRKVKILTENGVVYLLGILTRAEAARVTSAVQEVAGVQKIVRVFEYVD